MHYNKLVRDKIPEYLTSIGVPFEVSVADEAEYTEELYKKLLEEVQEFLNAKSSEELADVMEVIDALRKLPEFANVLEVKMQKLKKKGGFEKRIIVKGER
jgi:predicted house-cleaning noncanonical NTP pyrophosphatase (MazG superfamily)